MAAHSIHCTVHAGSSGLGRTNTGTSGPSRMIEVAVVCPLPDGLENFEMNVEAFIRNWHAIE
jgi:hypothetical protein